MKTQKNQRYLNLNRCAKDLSNTSNIQFTDNALPVTMEAIYQLESLPPPEEVNGVDLKILYKTLANLMAGYPVNEIEDDPTKVFLYQCFSVCLNQIDFFIFTINYLSLQDVINSAESTNANNLEKHLLKQDENIHHNSWLCNSNYAQYLVTLLKSRVQEFTVQIEQTFVI